jgi:ElaA protein
MIQRFTYRFDELSPAQLYQILALRSEVFVVEQECIYQDLDNLDQQAMHLLGVDDSNNLVSYARILTPGVVYPEYAIGRVIVSQSHRGTGEGHKLMNYCMEVIESMAGKVPIRISAQAHLEKFYQTHRFKFTGKSYLEDGIPHVEMIYYPNLAP